MTSALKKRELMDQEVSTRVQQVLEQIGEDESLTSDLTDPAATALLDWITQQIQAANAVVDDQAFQERVSTVRAAARKAAKIAADEDLTATVVLERAQAALDANLAQSQVVASQPAEPAPTLAPPPLVAEPLSAASDNQRAEPARQRSVWNSLRRRMRRWVHGKV